MTTELFVPGRLCLFGEHSDWAGGYRAEHPEIPPGLCLVSGTDQGLWAKVRPEEGVLVLESELGDGSRFGPEHIPMDETALAGAAASGSFFSYAAGTGAEIQAGHPVGGLGLRIRADLPVAKGLASSAAICVLVARALARTYALGLSPRDEMELAYAGERRAGSECGRMDQICAFGRRTSLLHFDGPHLEVELLDPGASVFLLIVDLGRGKDTRRILTDLNTCFPDTPGALAARVREALGEGNRALVLQARDALRAGEAEALGRLMTEAQALFDEKVAPACPSELRSERLHAVLAHPAAAELAWGGKGVGSQGDGCAQFVTRGRDERAALAARLRQALDVACLPLTLRPGAAEPADPRPPATPLPTRIG